MISKLVVTIGLTASSTVSAFGPASTTSPTTTHTTTTTNLHMVGNMPDAERMKKIMEEESRNPENVKASAEMLKNLKPEDLDTMLSQMDNMPAAQREQMQAMGMNPELMRKSVEMMKSNPEMAKQMANMMETMSPEQIMEKSRAAQNAFEAANPQTAAASSSGVVDAQVVDKDTDDGAEEEEEEEPIPPPAADILDTLYRAAELMSSPPTGKVTYAGFSTIPPISLLIGTDAERDVSLKELKECWADGSLGATRVDRAGFERVWVEVQEYFSTPIIEKARERAVGQKARTTVASVASPVQPIVGDAISDTQMDQVKNMSDDDMNMMLEQMQNMTPAMQDQMKAMGVDPRMMQKTADMMNSNPLMKNAARMMMKNMSAEQMRNASQRAQEQMSKMTPEEREEALKRLEEQSKQ